jgi:hypothetical protein
LTASSGHGGIAGATAGSLAGRSIFFVQGAIGGHAPRGRSAHLQL